MNISIKLITSRSENQIKEALNRRVSYLLRGCGFLGAGQEPEAEEQLRTAERFASGRAGASGGRVVRGVRRRERVGERGEQVGRALRRRHVHVRHARRTAGRRRARESYLSGRRRSCTLLQRRVRRGGEQRHAGRRTRGRRRRARERRAPRPSRDAQRLHAARLRCTRRRDGMSATLYSRSRHQRARGLYEGTECNYERGVYE